MALHRMELTRFAPLSVALNAVFLPAALVVLTIAALVGCDKPLESPQEIGLTEVIVANPVVMQLVEWDEFVGRLAAVETVQVRSRVGGYLRSTHFEEGQLVKAGQLLAVIDQRLFQSEVNRAQADVLAAEAQLGQAESYLAQVKAEAERAAVHRELVQKELDRQRLLLRQNATSQQEVEVTEAEMLQSEADVVVAQSKIESAQSAIAAARAEVTVAEANLQLAELNLQYTEIRAPIDGRISYRVVTEGNLISGGSGDATLITTIVSLDPIHCYFDADEQTYLKYLKLAREGKRPTSREVSNPVYLALADERGNYPHQGHMDFVDNRLDDNTGTIRGRAVLPNPDFQLTPGMFARVRLPGSSPYEAILIPDQAIGTDQAQRYVLVVDQQNLVRRVEVTLGPISHRLRIIRSGLNGQEKVIISGLQRARPGNEVNPTFSSVEIGSEALPNEYQPIPKEQWLTPPRRAAANVEIPPDSLEGNPLSP